MRGDAHAVDDRMLDGDRKDAVLFEQEMRKLARTEAEVRYGGDGAVASGLVPGREQTQGRHLRCFTSPAFHEVAKARGFDTRTDAAVERDGLGYAHEVMDRTGSLVFKTADIEG